MRYLIFLIGILACISCAVPFNSVGQLGLSEGRRVVIIGENVRPEIALYYQKEYDALVWFTPYQGNLPNITTNFIESGVGPSRAMRILISELKSINDTVGRWEIIIPKVGEKYFYNTLKAMNTHALSKARGMIICIDSKGFPKLEAHVKRVTDGNFFVSYEFQKDIK